MRRRARITVIGAAVFTVLVAPSCASVLGLTGNEDAIAALCQCDEQLDFYGSRCEEVLTKRLDGASEQTRNAWLEKFADEECSVCQNALECYYEEPTCGLNACDESEECCGYLEGTGYCNDGACVFEPEGCQHSFAPCTSVSDCCGSEVEGLAQCEDLGPDGGGGKACIELCSLDEANCKACGTLQIGVGPEASNVTICFDGTELATISLCNPARGDEDCAAQSLFCACVAEAFGPGTCIFACTPDVPQ